MPYTVNGPRDEQLLSRMKRKYKYVSLRIHTMYIRYDTPAASGTQNQPDWAVSVKCRAVWT